MRPCFTEGVQSIPLYNSTYLLHNGQTPEWRGRDTTSMWAVEFITTLTTILPYLPLIAFVWMPIKGIRHRMSVSTAWQSCFMFERSRVRTMARRGGYPPEGFRVSSNYYLKLIHDRSLQCRFQITLHWSTKYSTLIIETIEGFILTKEE
jgi:hypothetical protein